MTPDHAAPRRWRHGLLALVLGAFVFGPPAIAGAEEFSEYALEAAYLFKFGAFVDWPAETFAKPDTPVVLCVLGTDPLGEGFEKSLESKMIGARPFVVRRVKTVSRDIGCHILYVAASEAKQAQAVLESLHGSPILTVTDASAPGSQGEIIHFVVTDNRVRFEIDDEAAAAGGLTISSRLLSLAVSVKVRK